MLLVSVLVEHKIKDIKNIFFFFLNLLSLQNYTVDRKH